MDSTNGRKILVIGSEPELAEIVERSLGPSFQLIYASNENEAFQMARKESPDAIVLGHLNPRGKSFELHRRLRGGWVTKHIPLLVVDTPVNSNNQNGWTRDEGMQMDAEDYIAATQLIEANGLKQKISDTLNRKLNPLREALIDPQEYCVTWEQIPGKGAFERQQEETIENVHKAAQNKKIHAISVTDNPGGNPAISTEMLCTEIKRLGMEPLVHLAARDKNRNEIESMLHGLAAGGVRNLLVLTGDAPSSGGFAGKSKPVFDLDPIHVLQLAELMNSGLEYEAMRKKMTLTRTDFFAGGCISPFKKLESELMCQYSKLNKKIDAGAKFIITQVGYDARKFHEILQWLKVHDLNIPVIANIYVLPYGAGKLMNSNQIPGCVVTDKLLKELAQEKNAEDKGKSARILRAAQMYAVTKGMGYAGAHIGGHGISCEMVEEIMEKGNELSKNWESLVPALDYPQHNGFYYFEKDTKTGLNTDTPAIRPLKPSKPMSYRLTRVAHHLLFNEKSRQFKALKPIAKRIDNSPTIRGAMEFSEHLAKVAMFGCMNCGDCALFDLAYICPMSQCPKNQRNGPCGGSNDGWCEVYPNERKCVWVRAYDRLKAYKEEDKISDYIVPPCNWELWETSSWLNFYLGRDHTAKRLGIEPPEDKSLLEESSAATAKATT